MHLSVGWGDLLCAHFVLAGFFAAGVDRQPSINQLQAAAALARAVFSRPRIWGHGRLDLVKHSKLAKIQARPAPQVRPGDLQVHKGLQRPQGSLGLQGPKSARPQGLKGPPDHWD